MLDYAAFPKQRQALICQILQENGRVVCAELASRLNVSEHTIRRDLHELSREGYCKKVYGGAVMTLPEAGDYSERKEKNTATKSRIAQKCAKLVKPGGCIFIDTGTTNLAMAEALPAELALNPAVSSQPSRHSAASRSWPGGFSVLMATSVAKSFFIRALSTW